MTREDSAAVAEQAVIAFAVLTVIALGVVFALLTV